MAKNATADRTVRIPSITDPCGTGFSKAKQLGQTELMIFFEHWAIAAFRKMGVTMTDTCTSHQTIMAPDFREHVAFGDTEVVIIPIRFAVHVPILKGALGFLGRHKWSNITLWLPPGRTPEAHQPLLYRLDTTVDIKAGYTVGYH